MKKLWNEITQYRGVYSAKDVFKALAFAGGLLICLFAAGASFWGIHVDTQPAVMLLLLAFGLQAGKGVEKYFSRSLVVQAEETDPSAEEPL